MKRMLKLSVILLCATLVSSCAQKMYGREDVIVLENGHNYLVYTPPACIKSTYVETVGGETQVVMPVEIEELKGYDHGKPTSSD